MINRKTNRKALLMSVLSMVACLALLIGSTFAWFTDAVSTGVNTITAGNLNMKLEVTTNNGAVWSDVTTSTKLFDDAALWEPGHTEIAYLRLSNVGDLAFKYRFSINIISEVESVSVTGAPIKLSEILQFGVVENEAFTAFSDRAAAGAAATGALVDYAATGNMLRGDVKYIAIVVTMPTTTGNEANYRGTAPSIKLGVNAVATQDTVEEDSFDDQYDFKATYPAVVDPVEETMTNTNAGAPAADVVIENESKTIKVTVPKENYPDAGDSYKTDVKVELVGSSADSSTYEVDVTVTKASDDSEIALAEPAMVEVDLVAGLTNVTVTHNGVAMTAVDNNAFTADQQYSYNATSGVLTIYSKTFSPFKITYDTNYEASVNGIGYLTLRNAFSAAKDGDTVVVLKDVALPSAAIPRANITLDLNGHTLQRGNTNASSYMVGIASSYTVTINNGTIISPNYRVTKEDGTTATYAGTGILNNGNLTLNNVNVNGGQYGIRDQGNGAVMTMNGGTVVGGKYGVAVQHQGSTTVPVFNMNSGTVKAPYGVMIYPEGHFNMNGGEVVASTSTGLNIQLNGAKASTNISGGKIYGGQAGIFSVINSKVNISGTADISGSFYALAGNGSQGGTEWTVSGGKLSGGASGIFHPQNGSLTVSGGDITGTEYSGLEQRAGSLHISGGTFTSLAETFSGEKNDSGVTTAGAGVAISQHSTEYPITVVVDGGIFNGIYSLYENDFQNKPESSGVTITINNGTFNGEILSVNDKIIDNRS